MTDTKTKLEAEETKLKERLAQIKARKQQIQARERAADAKKKRKDDTRRKILTGALVLELMESDPEKNRTFRALLNTFLSRNDDRALFDLPAIQTRADGEPMTGIPALDEDNTHPGS